VRTDCSCFAADRCIIDESCWVHNQPNARCTRRDKRTFRRAVLRCVNSCRALDDRCSCRCNTGPDSSCRLPGHKVCISRVFTHTTTGKSQPRSVFTASSHNLSCSAVADKKLIENLYSPCNGSKNDGAKDLEKNIQNSYLSQRTAKKATAKASSKNSSTLLVIVTTTVSLIIRLMYLILTI